MRSWPKRFPGPSACWGQRLSYPSPLGPSWEDYVTFAEAKGLKSRTVFLRYCVRNAILPQTTALALALGQILSGAVLVEVIFAYPGIGTVLFHAIRENDHFLIQGIVFSVIVALVVATLLLDVLYPWLDPRITYRRA